MQQQQWSYSNVREYFNRIETARCHLAPTQSQSLRQPGWLPAEASCKDGFLRDPSHTAKGRARVSTADATSNPLRRRNLNVAHRSPPAARVLFGRKACHLCGIGQLGARRVVTSGPS